MLSRYPEVQTNGWANKEQYDFNVWMSTPTFADGIKKLQKLRDHWHNVAVFCSESLYYKCHRNMISDAWVAMGGSVKHLIDNKVVDHPNGSLLLSRLERYDDNTKKLWK